MSLIPRVAPRLRMTTDLTGGLLSLTADATVSSHMVVRESPVNGQRSRGEGSRMNSGLPDAPKSAGACGVCDVMDGIKRRPRQ